MNNELNNAVFKNDLNKVKDILKNKPYIDINENNEEGSNPLIYSLSQKNYDMIYILLEHDLNPDCKDKLQKSILHYAIELNDYGIIKNILDKEPNLEQRDAIGRTPLHYSIFLGHINIAMLLIERGASVTSKDNNGATLLHTICLHGDNQFLDLLISMGLDINQPDYFGITPIFYAAMFNQAITVIFLYKREAELDILIEKGNDLFLTAVDNDSEDVVKALIDIGFDINYTNDYNQTALHLAIENKSLNIILLLLKYGIDTNINSENGSVLHEAIAINSPEIVSFLMLYGVNANLLDNQGNTAFHKLCLTLGDIEVKKQCIDLLVKYRCNINKQNIEGNTAMHFAAAIQDIALVKALVGAGAKQSIKNKLGLTPQDLFSSN